MLAGQPDVICSRTGPDVLLDPANVTVLPDDCTDNKSLRRSRTHTLNFGSDGRRAADKRHTPWRDQPLTSGPARVIVIRTITRRSRIIAAR